MKLTTDQTVSMLNQVCDAIIAAEPLLTDADRNLGDGDHGIGMARGMTSAKEALSNEFNTPGEALKAMGTAMMTSMGGASGAIFGTLFRAGGKACGDATTFGSPELSETLSKAVEGIIKRGGAKIGDKTMLDALIPASEVAKESETKELNESLSLIATAAEEGKEASKDLIATMGRAKTLGEKSIGHPDAGACSVAIILQTMSDYVNSL